MPYVCTPKLSITYVWYCDRIRAHAYRGDMGDNWNTNNLVEAMNK